MTLAKVPWAASIHPIVPGLAVALVLIVAVTPFTRPAPPEALARFFKPEAPRRASLQRRLSPPRARMAQRPLTAFQAIHGGSDERTDSAHDNDDGSDACSGRLHAGPAAAPPGGGQQRSPAERAAAAQAEHEKMMAMPRPIDAVDSVWLEELTWLEVRDAMQRGQDDDHHPDRGNGAERARTSQPVNTTT